MLVGAGGGEVSFECRLGDCDGKGLVRGGSNERHVLDLSCSEVLRTE